MLVSTAAAIAVITTKTGNSHRGVVSDAGTSTDWTARLDCQTWIARLLRSLGCDLRRRRILTGGRSPGRGSRSTRHGGCRRSGSCRRRRWRQRRGLTLQVVALIGPRQMPQAGEVVERSADDLAGPFEDVGTGRPVDGAGRRRNADSKELDRRCHAPRDGIA